MRRAALAGGLALAVLACRRVAVSDTPPLADASGRVAAGEPSPPPEATRRGNLRIPDFETTKKLLARIYEDAHRTIDLYCGCPYSGHRIDLAACGYVPRADPARAARMEWEHVVAAESFGKSFVEWREGSPSCTSARGAYHGRKCAEHAAPEFKRIEADMHNLFPAVGEVNGDRSNDRMGMIEGERRVYGACDAEIEDGVFEPRPEVRGDIARAYQYMDWAYPEHARMSPATRKLMEAWAADDPVDEWERERNRLIERVQGNANPFIR